MQVFNRRVPPDPARVLRVFKTDLPMAGKSAVKSAGLSFEVGRRDLETGNLSLPTRQASVA